MKRLFPAFVPFFLASLALLSAQASESEDMAAVAALDMQYQATVKANDAVGMARILADDFVLAIGNGMASNKADLLKEAKDHVRSYEHQEDTEQTVRVWGDAAAVTAKLWLKGVRKDGVPFDSTLWFSDAYVRTASGWHYVSGQASLPLPKS